MQACTTYFTDSARNTSQREVGGHSGGLGTVPPVGSRGKAPGQGVTPEADDDLLIQQQNFCAHSYFYSEIQL